jgi:hypothetical protein
MSRINKMMSRFRVSVNNFEDCNSMAKLHTKK